MRPTFSIICFTVLSGIGYGAWFLIGLGVAVGPLCSAPGARCAIPFDSFAGWPVAFACVSVGLLCSLGHLGKPARAWRALSQWRSSWLSREGVFALVTFVPALALIVLSHADGLARLSGALLNGYLAPSLLPGDLAARGWNHADLSAFLEHGMSAQGSMFNEMFPVLHHSTQHMDSADLQAMASYLLGDQPPAAKVVQAVAYPQLSASAKRGRQQYLNVCAGCHGTEGEGKPHIAVAMQGNTTLRLADSRNLLRVIVDGIGEQQFGGFERMQPMPGFADKLDDAQLTDLLNYLRQSWGGLPGDLDAKAVAQLKSDGVPVHAGKAM